MDIYIERYGYNIYKDIDRLISDPNYNMENFINQYGLKKSTAYTLFRNIKKRPYSEVVKSIKNSGTNSNYGWVIAKIKKMGFTPIKIDRNLLEVNGKLICIRNSTFYDETIIPIAAITEIPEKFDIMICCVLDKRDQMYRNYIVPADIISCDFSIYKSNTCKFNIYLNRWELLK